MLICSFIAELIFHMIGFSYLNNESVFDVDGSHRGNAQPDEP